MTQPVLEATHLTRTFGDFVAVDDVTFTHQPGEICLLYTSPSPRD